MSLSDVRPFPDEGPSMRQEALAPLQKGVICSSENTRGKAHADQVSPSPWRPLFRYCGLESPPACLVLTTGLRISLPNSGRHIANAFRSRPGRCRCAWHLHHWFAGTF